MSVRTVLFLTLTWFVICVLATNLGCDSTVKTLKYGPNNWKTILEGNTVFSDTASLSGDFNGFTGENSLYDTNSSLQTVDSVLKAPFNLAANTDGRIDFKRVTEIDADARLWNADTDLSNYNPDYALISGRPQFSDVIAMENVYDSYFTAALASIA